MPSVCPLLAGRCREEVNSQTWALPSQSLFLVGEAGKSVSRYPIPDFPLHSRDQKLGTKPHGTEAEWPGRAGMVLAEAGFQRLLADPRGGRAVQPQEG